MLKENQIFIRTEETKAGTTRVSKVIVFSSGNRVQIPIKLNGEIKWFDDSKLLKK